MVKRIITACIFTACTYDPSFSDCTIHCTADTECPDGLTCKAEGLCREQDATTSCSAVHPFASCDELAATCGPNGNDACCSTAAPIPGGTFYRGYDVATDGMHADMSHPATLSSFMLDKYEVTVGRFRKFVEAGVGTQMNPPPSGAGARALNGTSAQGGWDPSWNASLAADTAAFVTALNCTGATTGASSWTDAPDMNEALPMNCVTWYEAFAFCAWDGGFLPTETERSYAATGGAEQRAYPWSTPAAALTVDCSYANYGGSSFPATACTIPGTGGVNRVGSESPKGDGRWGHSDLSGNVWEWTLDWYRSPYVDPCNDCADVTPASGRVSCGGAWYSNVSTLRGAEHAGLPPNAGWPPNARGGVVGVRCARLPH